MLALITFISLASAWQPALAAAYVLPGALPPGCSASADGYRCSALTLGANDSIRLATATASSSSTPPVTLSVDGALNLSSASINAAGTADALTLLVTGVLTVDSGATLIAHVTAASVAGVAASGVRFGGTLTTTDGGIELGVAARVAGTLSSGSGVISLGPNGAFGAGLSSSGAITVAEFSLIGGAISGSTGAITIGHDAQIGGAVTSTTGAIDIGYGASIGGAIRSTTGAIAVAYQARVSGPVSSSSGAIGIGYQSRLDAALTSNSGPISLGYDTTAAACVKSTGSAPIALAGGVVAQAVCCGGGAGSGGGSTCTDACVQNSSRFGMPALCSAVSSGPHHLEIHHGSGSGLTCSASTLTVLACADAACSAPYTGGVSGSLAGTGTGSSNLNWPNGAGFNIPGGSSSTRVALQVTAAGSVALGVSAVTPAPSVAASCNFGAPACSFSAADAGFLIGVPDHAADSTVPVSVSAVRKSDRATVCVPAFASVSKSLSFSCTYLNPASGTLAARLRGVALNSANLASASCDAGGHALTLDFNASGVASVALQYADVGLVQLNARYTGTTGTTGSEAGLVMRGSGSFISAPASFGFTAISAAPLRAGAAFGASVTALNRSGATTPNFGLESPAPAVTLGFVRVQPSGAGAADGVFSGSLGRFSAGQASAANLLWSEVGRGDLTATLASASYLGSGLSARGSSADASSATGTARTDGAVGRFTPHHFDVVVTPACGVFSYAAQPFAVRVTAMNGLLPPGPTLNYDASAATAPNFAQALTLSAAPALRAELGSLGGNAFAASQFRAGVAMASTPVFAFTTKLTAAQTLRLRAMDADAVSSQGYAEGATALRSGRLRVSNAFGSEKAALALAVQAQYWSGSAWVLNSADSCSVLPASAVALGAYLDDRGLPTAAWSTRASAVNVNAGQGTLTLSAPSPQRPAPTGSVDLALNLGAASADQSCLAAHPPSTGAALVWLRSQYGACASAGSDPAARASFGPASAENRRNAYVRDLH